MIRKLEKFQCAVTLINGRLYQCKLDENGAPIMFGGDLWDLVTGPVTQEFIDEVNAALGTTFKVEDF